MKHEQSLARAAAVLVAAAAAASATSAQDMPFGDAESVGFAASLWDALGDAKLVGEDAIRSHAYIGGEPHGFVLEQTETVLDVAGRADTVIVKSNYAGEDGDLTADDVMSADWDQNLVAVTVMFRRESGYNSGAGDWFWAKYLPDGTLDQTPGGVQMAGRVQGCIQCHADASGDDYVFMHDRHRED